MHQDGHQFTSMTMWNQVPTCKNVFMRVHASPPSWIPAPGRPSTSEPPPAELLWATHRTSQWWCSWRAQGTGECGSCWQMAIYELYSYIISSYNDHNHSPVHMGSVNWCRYIWQSTVENNKAPWISFKIIRTNAVFLWLKGCLFRWI